MGILTDDLAAFRARMTRRAFLGRTGAGLGSLALASLLEGSWILNRSTPPPLSRPAT